jgi:hypothetical protein
VGVQPVACKVVLCGIQPHLLIMYTPQKLQNNFSS